jgi:hypothetical protein
LKDLVLLFTLLYSSDGFCVQLNGLVCNLRNGYGIECSLMGHCVV